MDSDATAMVALLIAVALWLWPSRARITSRRRRARVGRVAILVGATVAAVSVPAAAWGPGVSAVLVALTAIRLLRRARGRRLADRDSVAVLGALSAMIRELHVGMPPSTAAARVAADQPPWLAELLTGGAPPDAWEPLARRLRAAEKLSASHGIAMAVVLDAVVRDLTDRVDAAARRATQTAGPVMSGYVLAALPCGGILLGTGMGADPIQVLLGSPLGGVLLVVGVALTCAGLLWADRIVQGRGP